MRSVRTHTGFVLTALFLAAALAGCTTASPLAAPATPEAAPTAAPAVFTPPCGDAGALPGEPGVFYQLWQDKTIVDAGGGVVLQGGEYAVLYDPVTGEPAAITEERVLDNGGERETYGGNGFWPEQTYVSEAAREQRVFLPDGTLLADWADRRYSAGPSGTLLYTENEWQNYLQDDQDPETCGAITLADGTGVENDLAIFYLLDAQTAFYRTVAGEYGLCDLAGGARTPLPARQNYAQGFPDSEGLYAVGTAEYGMGECSIGAQQLVKRDLEPVTGVEQGSYTAGDGGTIQFYPASDGTTPRPPERVYTADGTLLYTAPEGEYITYSSEKVIGLRKGSAGSLVTPAGEEISRVPVNTVEGSKGDSVLFCETTADNALVKRLLRADGSEWPLPADRTICQVSDLLSSGNLLVEGLPGTPAGSTTGDSAARDCLLLHPDGSVQELGTYRWVYTSGNWSRGSVMRRTDPTYIFCQRMEGSQNSSFYDVRAIDGTLLLSGVENVGVDGDHFIVRKGFYRGVMDKNGKWLYRVSIFSDSDGG